MLLLTKLASADLKQSTISERMKNHSYFANLGDPSRVWAIPAINGQVERLNDLHNMIWHSFQPGDKIVYLGNYLGLRENQANPDAIDSIIMFCNALAEQYTLSYTDIVHLRGVHEELLQKLLQLQFANRPHEVLQWMNKQGIDTLLNHYGTSAAEGLAACRSGVIALTRWTSNLRAHLRDAKGHDKFYQHLKRAAYTHSADTDEGLLFVNSGLDSNRPLFSQKDSFWWDGSKFDTMQNAYAPFRCVVRGYDPHHKGVYIDSIKISLDDNSDQGGNLVCATLNAYGEVLNLACA